MFLRLLLVLFACVAPLWLTPVFEAEPPFADQAVSVDADADASTDAAEQATEAIEDDVGGFEPPTIRAPADPRKLISYEPGEATEPRPPGRAVLTRPPV